MTPGAGETQQASYGPAFSAQLTKHAGINLQNTLIPVGPAELAQGIRRGSSQGFYYDLRSESFLPLGPNHPAAIAASLSTEQVPPQIFSPHLCQRFPGLDTWQWSLAANPTKQTHCPPLTHDSGWEVFQQLSTLEEWSAPLDAQTIFQMSRTELPPFPSSKHYGWLKVFLTEDMLGAQGRLKETREWLKSVFPKGDWEGHVYRFKPNTDTTSVMKDLAERGLAVDAHLGDIVLTFPVSFFYEDARAIAALLHQYQG